MTTTRITTLQWCLFLVLMQALRGCCGSSNFRWYCDLDKEPIVELRWDPEEHTYVVWDGHSSEPYASTTANPYHHNGAKTRRLTSWREDEEDVSPFSFLRGGAEEEYILGQEAALSAVSFRHLQQSANGTSAAVGTTIPLLQNRSIVTKLLVRRCPCWNPSGLQVKDFYCPLQRSHCGLGAGWKSVNNPSSPSGTSFIYEDPGCLDIKRQRSFARNVWPIVTVWYLAMFLCLCLTRPGRHAMGCCISKVWPRWNYYATERIIRQNPDHANRVVFRHMAARSGQVNRLSYAGFEVTFELAPMPSSRESGGEEFVLRTKTFRYDDQEDRDFDSHNTPGNAPLTSNRENGRTETQECTPDFQEHSCANTVDATPQHSANTDDDDEASQALISCTICHLELEDGERIGDLPCGHTFHIDCLKSWIARRNVCPLCLAENIATPRQQQSSSSSEDQQSTSPELAGAEEE